MAYNKYSGFVFRTDVIHVYGISSMKLCVLTFGPGTSTDYTEVRTLIDLGHHRKEGGRRGSGGGSADNYGREMEVGR